MCCDTNVERAQTGALHALCLLRLSVPMQSRGQCCVYMGLQIKNTRGGSRDESGKQGAVTVWEVCPVFGIRHCVFQTTKARIRVPVPCPGCHSTLFPCNNFRSRLAQAHSMGRRCRIFTCFLYLPLSVNTDLDCFVQKVNELDRQTQNLRIPLTCQEKNQTDSSLL